MTRLYSIIEYKSEMEKEKGTISYTLILHYVTNLCRRSKKVTIQGTFLLLLSYLGFKT